MIKAKELSMAKELIQQLSDTFNPSEHHDTYIDDLKKIIESKAKGKKIKTYPKIAKITKPSEIIDLLKQSLSAGRH